MQFDESIVINWEDIFMIEEIRKIILLGENVNTELKEAEKGLPKNIFETVCSFLNTTRWIHYFRSK